VNDLGATAFLQGDLDCTGKAVPVVEHHPRGRAQGMEVFDSDVDVFDSISHEMSAMELIAIDLDRDDFIHHEVDPFGVVQANLRPNLVPGQPQPSAREAFGKRLAVGIDPVSNAAPFEWQSQDERLKIDEVERTRVERPVHRGHRGLKLLVENDADESIDESDGHGGSPLTYLRVIPVERDAAWRVHVQAFVPILLGPKPRGVFVHGDVKRMRVENPTAARDHRRNTGQTPANPHRANFGRAVIHGCVPAISNPSHLAASNGTSQVEIAGSPSHKLPLLAHATTRADNLSNIGHGIIIEISRLDGRERVRTGDAPSVETAVSDELLWSRFRKFRRLVPGSRRDPRETATRAPAL
jgi:hypothetical protein